MASFFSRGGGSNNEPSPAPKPTPAPQRPVQRAPQGAEPSRSSSQESTLVARGSTLVGEVTGNAELVIEGVVKGEIHLDSRLVIGETGRVEGKVFARSVQVAGKVEGNVSGRERIEVLPSGRLEGDVVAPSVVIAEGAFFKGTVEMTDPKPPKTSQGKGPAPGGKPGGTKKEQKTSNSGSGGSGGPAAKDDGPSGQSKPAPARHGGGGK